MHRIIWYFSLITESRSLLGRDEKWSMKSQGMRQSILRKDRSRIPEIAMSQRLVHMRFIMHSCSLSSGHPWSHSRDNMWMTTGQKDSESLEATKMHAFSLLASLVSFRDRACCLAATAPTYGSHRTCWRAMKEKEREWL